MSKFQRFLPLLLLVPMFVRAELPVVEHDIHMHIDESTQFFTVTDRVSVADPRDATRHLPTLSMDPTIRIRHLAFDGTPVDVIRRFQNGVIDVPPGTHAVTVKYGDQLDESQWPYVVWLPGDGWYPEAKGHRLRFELTLSAPAGWSSLTQGVPGRTDGATDRTWIQNDPQQGIYLVTGPWHAYAKTSRDHRAGVLLIEDEGPLADTYLDAALRYLERYGEAFGDYPYHSFTLVENRRETGWGMPGFTLLGSRIIRLPFILHTSFPHEILHSWWGNGVFVDAVEGNWSEGLTTYLSDYIGRERRGEGRQYRLNTLIAWHDYAARGSDFPLARFAGRHDRATQAVGYGKGMFLFHMLRRELGDAAFMSALRALYSGYRFQYAAFSDVQRVFERTCRCDLQRFFRQWLMRTGAPALRLDSAAPSTDDGVHRLRVAVGQRGEPWRLRVPVRVVDVRGRATTRIVHLNGPATSIDFELESAAARVDVDPEIELFRMLDEGERPTTFSRLFSAERVAVPVADASFAGIGRELVKQNPGWELMQGRVADGLEAEAVVLLGWNHPLARDWFGRRRVKAYGVDAQGITINGESYPLDGRRVAAVIDTLPIKGEPKAVLWLAARQGDGLDDLMRRLPHYGRYSYAVFDSPARRATATGQWPAGPNALGRVLDHGAPQAPSPPATTLF